MSLATRCPSCGTIFRVVQDQLKVSEGWVRCGQCHEVFHGIEALFDLDSDPAASARRAAVRQVGAPPPTRVFADQRASSPIPMPEPDPEPAPPVAPPPPVAPRPAFATEPTAPAMHAAPAGAPSAFGGSGFTPPPAALRPGLTGFTPATLPPAPEPAPLPTTSAPPPDAPSPVGPLVTRGTIAPRFAARLAEEAARAQAAVAGPAPPAAEAALPTPAPIAPPPAEAPALAPLASPTPSPAPTPTAAPAPTPTPTPTPTPAPPPEPAMFIPPSIAARVPPPPARAEERGPSTLPSRLADDALADEDEDEDARGGPPTLASMLPEDAGEWPPRRTPRRLAGTEVAIVDPSKDPRFLREARSGARWRKPWVRAVLGAALVVLVVGAVGQVAWPQRDLLASRWPATLPAWTWACELAGCRIEAPRGLASLALDGSSLTRTDTEHVLLFSADLHNRANHAVRMPSFDLTFMDLNGEVVARKVLSPAQIGIREGALPPEGELHVHARLQVGALAASGFQADLFYP